MGGHIAAGVKRAFGPPELGHGPRFGNRSART